MSIPGLREYLFKSGSEYRIPVSVHNDVRFEVGGGGNTNYFCCFHCLGEGSASGSFLSIATRAEESRIIAAAPFPDRKVILNQFRGGLAVIHHRRSGFPADFHRAIPAMRFFLRWLLFLSSDLVLPPRSLRLQGSPLAAPPVPRMRSRLMFLMLMPIGFYLSTIPFYHSTIFAGPARSRPLPPNIPRHGLI